MARLGWVVATLGLALLAFPLARLPDPWTGAARAGALSGILQAALLAVLIPLHAWCYARWHEGGPRRITANELLTRLWFATFMLGVVLAHGGAALPFAVGAGAWSLGTWMRHRRLVNAAGRYEAAPNAVLLAVFLLGNAALSVMALR